MAQWNRLYRELGPDISKFYNEDFPIEVRQFLSEWIERQFRQNELQNPNKLSLLTRIISKIRIEIEKMVDPNIMYLKMRLLNIASKFSQKYENNPDAFHDLVQNVLNMEKQFLRNNENQITQSINNLKMKSQENYEFILALVKKYEEYVQYNAQNTAHLTQYSIHISEKINETINNIAFVQSSIISGYLSVCHGNLAYDLNIIQKWCEKMATIEFDIREKLLKVTKHIAEFRNEVLNKNTTIILRRLEKLLIELIQDSFVIVNQPPKIIKTDTRIRSNEYDSMVVRFLIGNIATNLPKVKVLLLSEDQVDSMRMGLDLGDSKGIFLNDSVQMTYDPNNSHLTADFKDIKLRKITHTDRKGTQNNVTDEKFALLFKTNLIFDQQNFESLVSVLSRPVSVIVHGCQNTQAVATILWHDAFCDRVGSAFHVPEVVPWNLLANVLSNTFENSTGRCLTSDNLNSLAVKLLDPLQTTNNFTVSWSQFCKTKLDGCSFTFWDWFYDIMKLTRVDLNGLWNDGHIIGFIQKETAGNMLANSTAGTFILRFSDKTRGGLSISWKTKNGIVEHIQPLTQNDFEKKPLANTIMELNNLITLYPFTTKKAAFKSYFKERSINVGYVPIVSAVNTEEISSTSSNR